MILQTDTDFAYRNCSFISFLQVKLSQFDIRDQLHSWLKEKSTVKSPCALISVYFLQKNNLQESIPVESIAPTNLRRPCVHR